MELNSYQSKTLRDLAAYLEAIDSTGDYIAAYRQHWLEQDIKVGLTPDCVPPYKDSIKGVPHICFKVPTGGGKTFMACAAVKVILDAMLRANRGKSRVVVWLVPSNAILEQTTRNLSDPRHPYRQRLERDFGGRVELYTKEQLLSGQNFSPATVQEQLSVCVLSYDSIRSKKKDGRKLYQENSQLAGFVKEFPAPDALVEGVDETALIQVLNQLCPVVIVDESHNAQSDLSVEMLRNLNPSFVLDLTATPKENSNIISYVDARELKKENMVKLPVVVYNRRSKKDVLRDAIQLRDTLESKAKSAYAAGEQYIRPIVLFQAQPKGSEDAETFGKMKEALIDIGIPKEHIAIKTSTINELKNVPLLSESCPVRYIITVNALKEGWDCPFAYILATLANRSSTVEVEQIVGRVLRQPYARKQLPALNLSYVLTCSDSFFETLENIVAGLNRAGFSKKDVRIGTGPDSMEDTGEHVGENAIAAPPVSVQLPLVAPPVAPLTSSKTQLAEELQEIDFAELRGELDGQAEQGVYSPVVEEMTRLAEEQSATYEAEAVKDVASGLPSGALGEKMNQFFMRPQFQIDAETLKIPQFFLQTSPNLLFQTEDVTLLSRESLSSDFTLKNEDTKINFALSADNMYAVDLAASGEGVPYYKKMTEAESKHLRQLIASSTPEARQKILIKTLSEQIETKKFTNCISSLDIEKYTRRIVEDMDADTLAALENSIPSYASKIQDKIEKLLDIYREKQFQDKLNTGNILCRPSYTLPKLISPADIGGALDKSLYESETAMNKFEQELIAEVSALDTVKWWHKIAERRPYSFCINGFINHYPDFMVLTESGKVVFIETKGDHLDSSDSAAKLRLGRKWADKAGERFRYFMVYQSKDLGIDGAYALDEFIGIMKKI